MRHMWDGFSDRINMNALVSCTHNLGAILAQMIKTSQKINHSFERFG